LKTSPGMLHAEFNWYNKLTNPYNVTSEEITAMMNLFSTRFNHAYILDGIFHCKLLIIRNYDDFSGQFWTEKNRFQTVYITDRLKFVLQTFATAQKSRSSHRFLKTYVANHPGEGNLTYIETVDSLKEFANMITTVNSIAPGTISGMVYKSDLPTYDKVLLAIESVLGPLESAPIDIGFLLSETEFEKTNTFFKKLKFMIINLKVNLAINPLQLVDSIIRRCEAYKENAKARGIQAEILCKVRYPSEGVSEDGTPASLERLYSFWCGIVEKLNKGTTNSKIVMKAAFDNGPNAFAKEGSPNPYLTDFNLGWWRRNSDSKVDESAYTEKIECKDYRYLLLNLTCSNKQYCNI